MAKQVTDFFFSSTDYGDSYPYSTVSALYQLDPDGTVDTLLSEGQFIDYGPTASLGDTIYFQAVSEKSGPGLYGLHDDGTYFYTGLGGTIFYSFGAQLFVDDYSGNLWTIDDSGAQTPLDVSAASAFTEYNDVLYFNGRVSGSTVVALTVDANGELGHLQLGGEDILTSRGFVEVNGSLFFGGSTDTEGLGLYKVDSQGVVRKSAFTKDTIPNFQNFIAEVDGVYYFTVADYVDNGNGGLVYATSLVSYDAASQDVELYEKTGYDYTELGGDLYFTKYDQGAPTLFKADHTEGLTAIPLPESAYLYDIDTYNGDLIVSEYGVYDPAAGTYSNELLRVSADGVVDATALPDSGSDFTFAGAAHVEFDGSLFFAANNSGDSASIVEIANDWSVSSIPVAAENVEINSLLI